MYPGKGLHQCPWFTSILIRFVLIHVVLNINILRDCYLYIFSAAGLQRLTPYQRVSQFPVRALRNFIFAVILVRVTERATPQAPVLKQLNRILLQTAPLLLLTHMKGYRYVLKWSSLCNLVHAHHHITTMSMFGCHICRVVVLFFLKLVPNHSVLESACLLSKLIVACSVLYPRRLPFVAVVWVLSLF